MIAQMWRRLVGVDRHGVQKGHLRYGARPETGERPPTDAPQKPSDAAPPRRR